MYITFFLSIPIGLISGLYAGLLVARYQRFADLRLQTKKVILQIDYIWEDNHMVFPMRNATPELSQISSDLTYLGHKEAAEAVLSLWKDVDFQITGAQAGRVNYESFKFKYLEWQNNIRALSPRMRSIIKLWGGL